jgi:glycosyltransferase involved in cell wall biosynthesis
MNEQHPERARILPIADGLARPLWSVMIPTYHCANYLRETLAHVLRQDPGPELMQIEVVDDGSTADDPAAVVQEIGRGRVGFYRQPQNVGHIQNFATCLNRSRGQLIHLLHGDDYVRAGFYQKMQRAFAENPAIGAAFCRQIFMDEQGHWQAFSPLEQQTSGILCNGLQRLALEQRIMTPSMVVRRTVYEQLGGFDCRLVCSEDWEMWVRIAARYAIWYEVQPLAVYRMHTASNTGRHTRSGEDIYYTRMAIEIFRDYLPGNIADKVARQAKETYAFSALDNGYWLLSKRDWRGAGAQLREAWRCSHSLRVVLHTLTLLLKGTAHWLRKMNSRKVADA